MTKSVMQTGRTGGAHRVRASGLDHMPELDGLRGVAILAVVGVNAEWPFLQGGFFGVDVFFVLSGFLITTLLLAEWRRHGDVDLAGFFLRRALRLMPALVVLLVFACVYTALFRPPDQRAAAFTIAASALFYVSNWVIGVGNVHGTLEHTWSLGVEGQFYILVAGIMVMALRRSAALKTISKWCIILALMVAVWRGIYWGWDPGVMRVYMGLDTRADSLLAGCLVALLWVGKGGLENGGFSFPSKNCCRVLSFLAWAILVTSFICVPGVGVAYPYRGGITLVAVASAVIVSLALANLRTGKPSFLAAAPLVWFGQISYSLYLWHVPLKNVFSVERLVPVTKSVVMAEMLRFAAFVAFACASYYAIERPFLRLKARFHNRCISSVPLIG